MKCAIGPPMRHSSRSHMVQENSAAVKMEDRQETASDTVAVGECKDRDISNEGCALIERIKAMEKSWQS